MNDATVAMHNLLYRCIQSKLQGNPPTGLTRTYTALFCIMHGNLVIIELQGTFGARSSRTVGPNLVFVFHAKWEVFASYGALEGE